MEVCVGDLIDPVLKDIDCCTCEKCLLDIMAIALNELPPKYVVTRKGEMYTKLWVLRQQLDVDIISALTKAAAAVGKNPRHDSDFIMPQGKK